MSVIENVMMLFSWFIGKKPEPETETQNDDEEFSSNYETCRDESFIDELPLSEFDYNTKDKFTFATILNCEINNIRLTGKNGKISGIDIYRELRLTNTKKTYNYKKMMPEIFKEVLNKNYNMIITFKFKNNDIIKLYN